MARAMCSAAISAPTPCVHWLAISRIRLAYRVICSSSLTATRAHPVSTIKQIGRRSGVQLDIARRPVTIMNATSAPKDAHLHYSLSKPHKAKCSALKRLSNFKVDGQADGGLRGSQFMQGAPGEVSSPHAAQRIPTYRFSPPYA
jgi:hypothetical protein